MRVVDVSGDRRANSGFPGQFFEKIASLCVKRPGVGGEFHDDVIFPEGADKEVEFLPGGAAGLTAALGVKNAAKCAFAATAGEDKNIAIIAGKLSQRMVRDSFCTAGEHGCSDSSGEVLVSGRGAGKEHKMPTFRIRAFARLGAIQRYFGAGDGGEAGISPGLCELHNTGKTIVIGEG